MKVITLLKDLDKYEVTFSPFVNGFYENCVDIGFTDIDGVGKVIGNFNADKVIEIIGEDEYFNRCHNNNSAYRMQ
jgi:hypothetical protein